MTPRCHINFLIGLVFAVLTGLQSISGAAAQQATPIPAGAPQPLAFPRDDGPHDQPVEWWYYTGHLLTADGERYGFEYVVFKINERGFLAYASHFAVTDNANGSFHFDQRQALASPDVNAPSETGFDITLGDWSISGGDGDDRLVASMPDYAIDLDLTSQKRPVLHDVDGFIDFGGGEYTYYYSRTRVAVVGTLMVEGAPQSVTGTAWFDHQWGDFLTVIASGWDWYAIQLDDDTELMLYVLREPDGATTWVRGSLVAPDGTVTDLGEDAFEITPTGSWTSPRTEIAYPSGWTIDVPALDLSLTLTPALADQELDTTQTTHVIYWEGEVVVAGTRAGSQIDGLGYVELNGYAPSD